MRKNGYSWIVLPRHLVNDIRLRADIADQVLAEVQDKIGSPESEIAGMLKLAQQHAQFIAFELESKMRRAPIVREEKTE